MELVSVVGARATRTNAVHGRVDQLGGVSEPRLGVIQQVRHLRMSIDASASRAPPREKRRAHPRVRGPNSRTRRATGASPRFPDRDRCEEHSRGRAPASPSPFAAGCALRGGVVAVTSSRGCWKIAAKPRILHLCDTEKTRKRTLDTFVV